VHRISLGVGPKVNKETHRAALVHEESGGRDKASRRRDMCMLTLLASISYLPNISKF
jgi:hypothetical protein